LLKRTALRRKTAETKALAEPHVLRSAPGYVVWLAGAFPSAVDREDSERRIRLCFLRKMRGATLNVAVHLTWQVEKLFQIKINHPAIACHNIPLRLSYSLMCRSPGSELIAVFGERRVPLALQNLPATPVLPDPLPGFANATFALNSAECFFRTCLIPCYAPALRPL
jgi:hypothetical protein